MKVSVVQAHADHIAHIAANVREADRLELWNYALLKPEEALRKSLDASVCAATGMVDGIPVAMFGIATANPLSDVGLPWLIGTSDIERHQMAFLRRNKDVVKIWLSCYARLENYVSCDNAKAIQWLKWIGFKFDEPQSIGLFGKPFMKFWMENNANG